MQISVSNISIIGFGLVSLKWQRALLFHEVMHLWVDPLNDGHQIVEYMFCVVHGGIHEVPEKMGNKKQRASLKVHNREPIVKQSEGGRERIL